MSNSFSELEAKLNDRVPIEYAEFLASFTFEPHCDYAINTGVFYWMVEEFYNVGSPGLRLESIYDSVCHAIPALTFPIISTLGGLVLLFGASKNDNNAYYWGHERVVGDDSLLLIARSAKELITTIEPYVDGGG